MEFKLIECPKRKHRQIQRNEAYGRIFDLAREEWILLRNRL